MRRSWKDKAQLMSREELALQIAPYLTHKKRKDHKRAKDQNKRSKRKAPGSRIAARHKSKLHKLGLTGSKLATAVKQKLAVKKAWEKKLALEAEESKKVRGRGTGRAEGERRCWVCQHLQRVLRQQQKASLCCLPQSSKSHRKPHLQQ